MWGAAYGFFLFFFLLLLFFGVLLGTVALPRWGRRAFGANAAEGQSGGSQVYARRRELGSGSGSHLQRPRKVVCEREEEESIGGL